MRNPAPTLLLAAALAACSDGTGPEAPETAPIESAPAAGAPAARDALVRIAPALGDGPAAAKVRAGLAALLQGDPVPAAIETALDELAADPTHAADADAIRLALDASR